MTIWLKWRGYYPPDDELVEDYLVWENEQRKAAKNGHRNRRVTRKMLLSRWISLKPLLTPFKGDQSRKRAKQWQG